MSPIFKEQVAMRQSINEQRKQLELITYLIREHHDTEPDNGEINHQEFKDLWTKFPLSQREELDYLEEKLLNIEVQKHLVSTIIMFY